MTATPSRARVVIEGDAGPFIAYATTRYGSAGSAVPTTSALPVAYRLPLAPALRALLAVAAFARLALVGYADIGHRLGALVRSSFASPVTASPFHRHPTLLPQTASDSLQPLPPLCPVVCFARHPMQPSPHSHN